jgi:spermidine synthase
MSKADDLGTRDRNVIFSGAVLILGASGIIGQLLLLRELLITFLSNELSIGIILANWLLIEAAGSYIGRFIERTEKKLLFFVVVTLVFSLCLPLAIYFARTWIAVTGAIPGEGMGLHQIFLASFLILLPVSLTHGALFTVACRIGTGIDLRDAAGIGRVYFLETAGTLAGGLVFTYLIITFLNPIEAAAAVSLVNIFWCLLLLRFKPMPIDAVGGIERDMGLFRKVAVGASVLLLTVTALVLFEPLTSKVHWSSIRKQWRDQEIVHYENSVYGNTTVIRREGQHTFFLNGIPTITVPTPDVAFVEEFAHLPMLLHPGPKKVLVISGVAGGVLNEVLKHTVKRVDYTELDPLILKLVRQFPTDLTETELNDPRVQVHHGDGRLFLKENPHRYDVVLIGLTNPQDLQLNRFFTQQFFSLVGKRLNEEGLVAFALPGSLTYMGAELRDLNACILNTLREVFPEVRVIPGDGTNLFLASPSLNLSGCDASCVLGRFRDAALTVRFVNPFHIRYRLDSRWSQWFSDSMAGATQESNEDFKPLGVFFSLSHWNAKFAPRLQRVLAYGGRVSLIWMTGVTGLALILLLPLVRRLREPTKASIPLAVASTGFSVMVLELALIFTFQALYGVVFYWVGLLVTAFMGGTAAGSLIMTRYMERIRRDMVVFLGLEGSMILFSVTLPLIFLGFQPYLERPGLTVVIRILFLVLSLLAGLLIGMEFPLASKMHLGISRGDVGGTAGLLYGADLMGGWFGGIAGGVMLLPVMGLVETCLTVGVLKLASFFLVAVAGGRHNFYGDSVSSSGF